jgi:hypothetical protein
MQKGYFTTFRTDERMNDEPYVSPYLRRPPRSYEEVPRERSKKDEEGDLRPSDHEPSEETQRQSSRPSTPKPRS